MLQRTTRLVVLTVMIAVAVGLLFSAAASAQEQNMLTECTTLDEPGTYSMVDDIEASPDGPCLVIESGGVTIDGDGYELKGQEDDSVGVAVRSDYGSDEVVLDNIRIIRWGSDGIEHTGGPLTVQDSDVMWNGRGYNGDQAADVRFDTVNVKINRGSGISTMMGSNVDLYRTEVVGNEGSGVSMADGGSLYIDESIFNTNDAYGVDLGYHVDATITQSDMKVNGEAGLLIVGSAHVEMSGGEITGNQDHGVEAVTYSNDDNPSKLTNVYLQGNDGKAINAYDEDEDAANDYIEGSTVHLDDGIIVDFGAQSLDLHTEPADEMETRALVVDGDESTQVDAEFRVNEQRGRLWYDAPDGWERRGEYDTGGSNSFTETLSTGRWGATSAPEQTSTPEPTDTPTDTPTPTDEPTSTPTDEPEQPDTSTDTPTNTDSDLGGSGIESSTETRTPSNSQPAVEPEPRTTRTDTDVPSDSATETETETTRGETATENETEMPATDDNTETTTTDDTTSSGDGGSPLQWYGIAVAIILLLATFTASLVTWE